MLEIKRATPEDAHAAFDIRREAIRSQCIGAYTVEQMMLWTRGKAEDGYSAHGEPGEQPVILEDNATVGSRAHNGVATDLDRAAAGFFEPGEDAEERAFATSTRADHGHELARGNVEIHVGHGEHGVLVVAVALGECADVNVSPAASSNSVFDRHCRLRAT